MGICVQSMASALMSLRARCLAILGPNGAGKTTTVEILEGHRSRDGGDVSVLGTDPDRGGHRFRDRIGIVLQAAGVDRELSTREALELYGAAYSNPRSIDELIELVELTGQGRRSDCFAFWRAASPGGLGSWFDRQSRTDLS